MVTTNIAVRHHQVLDSTNAEAARLWAGGERTQLWVTAARQSHGQGRLGRVWQSAEGNLFASLLLPLSVPVSLFPHLSFVAGCAVRDTVHHFLASGRRDVLLKWPNDCLIGGAKVSGILCEGLSGAAVIGIGINVSSVPDGLPYPATCINNHVIEAVSPAMVFDRLVTAMEKRLEQWENGAGFKAISREWSAHAIGVGEYVEVDLGKETIAGVFDGIGPKGEALLRVKRELVPIWSGDIKIRSLTQLRKVSA